MSWNPVLNKFIEIKSEYMERFGKITYEQEPGKSCFEKWVEELDIKEYIDLISPLQLTQYGNLLLIRYANYANIFSSGVDVTLSEFWEMYDGFYLECRSVVINIEKNELVLTPFKKFRNLNECEETSRDRIEEMIEHASCVEISNKLDGSMQVARYYNGEYVMSGSMALSHENSWRLEDGYSMLSDNYKEMLSNNPDITFIFEYISLKDAHVVKYKKEEEGLYLIGIRDVVSGKEYSYEVVKSFSSIYGVKVVEVYEKTFESAMAELPLYKSSEKEGFVLNIDGFKVKIKCDDYVLMHKMLDAISSVNLIIKNIADDTFDDFISKIPSSYKERVMEIANKVFLYIFNTESQCVKLFTEAPKKDKKEFMLWIDKNAPREYRGYLRQMYFGESINYIKSGSEKSPSYKKLKDMEIKED